MIFSKKEQEVELLNKLVKLLKTMELSHKPEWASHLMDTVELGDFFHHCPLSEKDNKEIRKWPKRRQGHEAEYEIKDIYFWIRGLSNINMFSLLWLHISRCTFVNLIAVRTIRT